MVPRTHIHGFRRPPTPVSPRGRILAVAGSTDVVTGLSVLRRQSRPLSFVLQSTSRPAPNPSLDRGPGPGRPTGHGYYPSAPDHAPRLGHTPTLHPSFPVGDSYNVPLFTPTDSDQGRTNGRVCQDVSGNRKYPPRPTSGLPSQRRKRVFRDPPLTGTPRGRG